MSVIHVSDRLYRCGNNRRFTKDKRKLSDVMKDLSEQWAEMSEEHKQPYVQMAQRDKIRYENYLLNKKNAKIMRTQKHGEEGALSSSLDSVNSSDLDSHQQVLPIIKSPQMPSVKQEKRDRKSIDNPTPEVDSSKEAIVLNAIEHDEGNTERVPRKEIVKQSIVIQKEYNNKQEETMPTPQKLSQKEFNIHKVRPVRKSARIQKEGCQQISNGSREHEPVNYGTPVSQPQP